MPSLVQEYREKLEKRAKELRPLVAELQEIEQALASFPKSRSRSRVNGRVPSTRPRRRRARRGQRSEQVLAVVREHPNITVSGMAKELGVKAQGLYPVSRKLLADGKLRKNGAKYSVKR